MAGRTSRSLRAYFFPGGWVNGEVPTWIAGFGFSALGLRTSLFLRTCPLAMAGLLRRLSPDRRVVVDAPAILAEAPARRERLPRVSP